MGHGTANLTTYNDAEQSVRYLVSDRDRVGISVGTAIAHQQVTMRRWAKKLHVVRYTRVVRFPSFAPALCADGVISTTPADIVLRSVVRWRGVLEKFDSLAWWCVEVMWTGQPRIECHPIAATGLCRGQTVWLFCRRRRDVGPPPRARVGFSGGYRSWVLSRSISKD